MSLGDRYARGFASPTARARVAEAVRAIEATTGAEVVVAVRAVSGEYTEADYRFGTVAGFAALLAFLFYPYEFDTNLFPLIYATTFVAATLLVRRAPPLRRLFVGAARARRAVELAARGELVGLGITRTRERTGLLVYVSIFERRVAVVADHGLEALAADAAWRDATQALEGSLASGGAIDVFLARLAALGPRLTALVPRRADDVNELSDEVRDLPGGAR